MTRIVPARSALTLLVGTLLSLCGTATLEAAVEIRITSGDLMTGDITQETDTTVQLKRVIMIRHKAVESTITLQKSSITSRKEVPALTEQYKTRAASTSEDVLSQCVLARWCYERALVEQSLHHTKTAEKLDNNNPIVAKLYNDLGFVKDETSAWVSQEEYLAKTGKVSLGGTIMTKEEAELAKNKIIQNSSASRLEQQIRDAEYTIKNAETKVAEYTAQRDEAKGDVAKAKSDAAGAKNRIESLSKRAEERSKQQQNNRSQQNEKNDQAALSEANSTYSKANADQKKSERELAAAEERLEKYKVTLEKAKKDLPGLKKQLEELTGKPASDDAATAAGKKPSTSDKPSDKAAPAAEKPKGRFGDL
jgi:chromosome segregation ATPase